MVRVSKSTTPTKGTPNMARHAQPSTSNVRKGLAVLALAGAAFGGLGGVALAEPSAPTNGGNGAGSSGQCTGPASERPTSCASPGGVSER
jgi:hypothetical protein